jgi:hypothetical protein
MVNCMVARANPSSPAAKMLQPAITYAPDWKQSNFEFESFGTSSMGLRDRREITALDCV